MSRPPLGVGVLPQHTEVEWFQVDTDCDVPKFFWHHHHASALCNFGDDARFLAELQVYIKSVICKNT